jgi:hypothetical protein
VLSLFITTNWHCPISKILFKKGLHRKFDVLSYMKFFNIFTFYTFLRFLRKISMAYPGFEPGPPCSEVRRAYHCAIGAPKSFGIK